ncbi:hypothetical protein VOLCADRAFT_104290 [Volvox carteri f. nagariensis]|uniref:Uncharacterized protein n=1 Tax=Volvox carteri f. nagariensis TaxID=3068 RepID=D8TSK4_VOLCA|nr:uncharacterized protein VOLCADRAFT_104290 [Volvox carteri f. nagariensis]EFJ49503.1 hypothetical protein VOLCADRAFT_104290 [Volvox carteri f. nagariensis]|eukprot:XP_002949484.1 hypothetical protein VOLCADRAFT_104290 [Volvox carteri f. nagariensis]
MHVALPCLAGIWVPPLACVRHRARTGLPPLTLRPPPPRPQLARHYRRQPRVMNKPYERCYVALTHLTKYSITRARFPAMSGGGLPAGRLVHFLSSFSTTAHYLPTLSWSTVHAQLLGQSFIYKSLIGPRIYTASDQT